MNESVKTAFLMTHQYIHHNKPFPELYSDHEYFRNGYDYKYIIRQHKDYSTDTFKFKSQYSCDPFSYDFNKKSNTSKIYFRSMSEAVDWCVNHWYETYHM